MIVTLHCSPVPLRLASIGRQVDYIRGDGNCFFRALSKEMYGSEEFHAEWREAVCDVIGRHPLVFSQYVDASSVGSHVQDMRAAGTWATTCEIYATATLLRREVYVLAPSPPSPCSGPSPRPNPGCAEEEEEGGGGAHYTWLLFSPRSLSGASAGGSLSRLTANNGAGQYPDDDPAGDDRGGEGGPGGLGGPGSPPRDHDDEVHPCYLTLCHTNGNHYDRITPVFARCNCELPPPCLNGVSVLLDLTASDEEESSAQA